MNKNIIYWCNLKDDTNIKFIINSVISSMNMIISRPLWVCLCSPVLY